MHSEHRNDSHSNLSPERLVAFSDGVIAIIITITVLEFKIPEGDGFSSLLPMAPLFVAYLISFQNVGTYWNNHHHLLRATNHVSAGIMWANLHLLFWLSFIPFTTGWLGKNHGGAAPTALYAGVLLMCAMAYSVLQWSVVSHSDNRDQLYKELYKSKKGVISVACYILAVLFAFQSTLVSDVLIVLVSVIWFIPDKRIEKYL